MAKATVKLFASLSSYLPASARNNSAEVRLEPDAATVTSALAALKVPMEKCHLVLLNGVFISPSARANCAVEDGDTISAWPPVAGG
jgi:molybdopterin converting factor small subunit